MAKKSYRKILVGLDVGTTKVAGAAGQVSYDGAVDVLGICEVPSFGLRRGNVIDIDSTSRAIDRCLNDLERMCGINIASARVGFSGANIATIPNRAVVAVGHPGNEIVQEDVERVVHAAKMIAIPPDRSIIHLLPRQFIVDGYEGVMDAVGMAGSRLEVEAVLVTAATTAVQNLMKAVGRAGLKVKELTLNTLLAAESVLSPAEKEMGVVLVDIGGGTMDISIYEQGGLVFSSIIPVGGEHITRDLAVGLRTNLEEANRIKEQHGCSSVDAAREDVIIEVSNINGQASRQVSEKFVASIIQPRIEEMLEIVQGELFRAGVIGVPPGGIVLTGGTSNLRGITRSVEEYLHIPARVGLPENTRFINGEFKQGQYAAVLGALLYDLKNSASDVNLDEELLLGSWLGRVILWFKDLFR
ncbi:MAG TPA: cell division protein FtsA [Syntrophothermus lipocalidus]|nr:cell division protein FtsA [Syntrophothermus lipocalidus]